MSWDFLAEWKFWSFLVAFVALILSQLPPIALWFKKAKLDLELYSRIHITHKVGNPNLQVHLILRNIGGRKVRVKGINVALERDGTSIDALPAQNYVPDPKTNHNVLLTPYTLKPEGEWSNLVNFLKFYNRDEEKEYRNSEKTLKDDLREQYKTLEKSSVAKVRDELVEPFSKMFQSKFIWHPGEYKMSLSVETENAVADIRKTFRFTLFESQSEEMASYVDDFNTGAGIYWDLKEHTGVIIQVEEING